MDEMFIPYQRCPICEGVGILPPYYNGQTLNLNAICTTCNGTKIIPKHHLIKNVIHKSNRIADLEEALKVAEEARHGYEVALKQSAEENEKLRQSLEMVTNDRNRYRKQCKHGDKDEHGEGWIYIYRSQFGGIQFTEDPENAIARIKIYKP